MKTKKILALLLATAMVFTMIGCGDKKKDANEATTDESVDTVVDDTTTDDADAAPTEASIDFEDGVYGFVGNNLKLAGGAGEATLSVEDYAGSKALKAVSSGKVPCIAFQIDALLGDNLANVKTIELSVGVGSPDGNFYACSGNLYGLLGDDLAKDAQAWSVYLETANPKTVTYTVPD